MGERIDLIGRRFGRLVVVGYDHSNAYNGFGFEQHCSVTSFGSDPYDVNLVIIDAISRNTGSEWEHAWWV